MRVIKIVVDTNIVYSGILNSTGKIGKILISGSKYFNFYSCDFLKIELLKHRVKLLNRTKLELDRLIELELLITKNITFIHEGLIPSNIYEYTELLLEDIDPKDTPFVALTKHLKAILWTGDKVLYEGLKKKKYSDTVSTSELHLLLTELEK